MPIAKRSESTPLGDIDVFGDAADGENRPAFPAQVFIDDARVDGETLSDAELAEIESAWAEALEETVARGPVTFSFPDELAGGVVLRDLVTNDFEQLAASGIMRIEGLVEVVSLELYHPSADLIARLPLQAVREVTISGASSGALAAVASHPTLEALIVDCVVGPEEAAELTRLWSTIGLDEPVREGGERVSGEVLAAALSPLSSLKVLAIQGVDATGAELSALPTMPMVEFVSFTGPRVYEGFDATSFLAAFPNLEAVDLFDDAALAADDSDGIEVPEALAELYRLRPDLLDQGCDCGADCECGAGCGCGH